MVLFISLVLIFALGVTTSIAQQKTKIAGKHTFAYTKQNTINVGDIEGHIIMLNEFEGINVSTGKNATTISPEGKPVTTLEGSWTYTKGTGKYENIQGSGSYKGKLISRTIFIIEWEGEYFIKK
jgi:uncharacterized protein affecting Mg2+/Co2+ transport